MQLNSKILEFPMSFMAKIPTREFMNSLKIPYFVARKISNWNSNPVYYLYTSPIVNCPPMYICYIIHIWAVLNYKIFKIEAHLQKKKKKGNFNMKKQFPNTIKLVVVVVKQLSHQPILSP